MRRNRDQHHERFLTSMRREPSMKRVHEQLLELRQVRQRSVGGAVRSGHAAATGQRDVRKTDSPGRPRKEAATTPPRSSLRFRQKLHAASQATSRAGATPLEVALRAGLRAPTRRFALRAPPEEQTPRPGHACGALPPSCGRGPRRVFMPAPHGGAKLTEHRTTPPCPKLTRNYQGRRCEKGAPPCEER